MTASAPVRPAIDRAVINAAASVALQPVLSAAPVEGRVLGVNSAAIWLRVGNECIVIERNGAGLPNGVTTVVPLPDRVVTGETAVVGDGAVVTRASVITIRRWWDPQPRLAEFDAADSLAAFERLGPPETNDCGLEAALTTGHKPSIVGSAVALVGLGDGLTPAGDDILSGTVATLRLHRSARAAHLADILIPAVLAAAEERTTLLSRSLLHHAAHGRVVRPVADLFTSLFGSSDPTDSYRRLLAIGHSSGPALAAGIRIGLRAIVGGDG